MMIILENAALGNHCPILPSFTKQSGKVIFNHGDGWEGRSISSYPVGNNSVTWYDGRILFLRFHVKIILDCKYSDAEC